ncbi:MAG: hypothetical protein HC813_01405 [Planctomycetes bacterium]|nr:hypothetical protein [Planctomycetota bacterium]
MLILAAMVGCNGGGGSLNAAVVAFQLYLGTTFGGVILSGTDLLRKLPLLLDEEAAAGAGDHLSTR